MSASNDLPPHAFRDMGAVVTEVLSTHDLRPGDALLALVRRPSEQAVVEHVSRIRGGRWRALDDRGRSDLIRTVVDAMPVPPWSRGAGPDHSVVTLVGRRGLAVAGAGEAAWWNAWWFSNCAAHVYKGDLVLVTEHGWCEVVGTHGGWTPRLAS